MQGQPPEPTRSLLPVDPQGGWQDGDEDADRGAGSPLPALVRQRSRSPTDRPRVPEPLGQGVRSAGAVAGLRSSQPGGEKSSSRSAESQLYVSSNGIWRIQN